MAALNRRDFHHYLDGFTDDYVFKVDRRLAGDELGEDLVVHRRSLLRFVEDFFDTWHEVRYEFDPDASLVNGRVFSHDRWVGRREAGDPETSIEFYAVATLYGNRFSEVAVFAERDEALAYARSG